MSPFDQEKLFARVRKRFKHRTERWCSGYVDGVIKGYSFKKIPGIYRTRKDPYADGFRYGFLDAFGSDALEFEWAKRLAPTGKALSYRWWERRR